MRRADPYQERARELCRAAGIDPDSRVGAGRGQPAWCLYRDAARKEKLAREAEAASAEIAMLRPQEERFKNAPLKVFGEHDAATIAQMRNCMAVGNVVSGVICADGHLGYAQPVGGVIAYEKQISISGVGFDIGCGNMAARLDVRFDDIRETVPTIIRDVAKVISFGIGRKNIEQVEHALFDDGDAWRESDMEAYRQKAAGQLGTVGSGNHYVDLMRDEAGLVWIGVHFGSRGLGHTSATRYLKAAGGKDGMNVPPAIVDEDSELGRRYIAAMQLAGRYAYAGREWVVDRVRRIIGGKVTDSVHNHHNYAWRETHDGKDLWVVRKGATPAFPGQRGFVGGSMGDDAVILEGVDSPEAKASLYSTVHGAGRLFGRNEAKRRFTREEMDRWLNARGVTLVGADLDESPMAYRRLPEVLARHAGTVKVLHTLRPFAVAMAGEGEFDPWKD
ncbi:RtcB family protein [Bradyrhizobium septentrionale]|uniref:3'-phosphate/5'-hydroxy nucleic acid ligase n=1 Tax=Bradyrhizobium septentrionale TaxID=1404411 RepID=A0A973W0M9_9BRAD|nr:RtcB family protein [Bradyrhizobium septentrionale]UGY13846.1 RtcB family protein [Bradyrhizobium septentrionale]UGY22398.1 RtcB family protein [Bradyrhizobium septentrionale]